MQYARRIRLRRPERPRDYRRKHLSWKELGEQVVDGPVEISCADGFLDGFGLEVGHEFEQAGLRCLHGHGGALDGDDFGHGGVLLGGGGQGPDVLEDVGGFGDAEGGAHLAEHVVLRFAGSDCQYKY